jgi:hypothetical protein
MKSNFSREDSMIKPIVARWVAGIFKCLTFVFAMIGVVTVISIALPMSAVNGADAGKPSLKAGVAVNPQILEPEPETFKGKVGRLKVYSNSEFTGCRVWFTNYDNPGYPSAIMLFTTEHRVQTVLELAYDTKAVIYMRAKKRQMPTDYDWRIIHQYSDCYFEIEDIIMVPDNQ